MNIILTFETYQIGAKFITLK